MEKLTTNQIIDAIKRNKKFIIIPALILGLLVFAKEILLEGKYQAETVLIVTSNDDKPITYNKLILNEKLANIYGQFLESDDLFQDVEKEVKADGGNNISNKFSYEVNPQGGVITLTYKDSDKNRAKDTLTLIAEEFRSFAKNYLNMENIEYLQKVNVNNSPKKRGIIFSFIGFFLGGLMGIFILIVREILSDKINSAADIREMNIEVLADLSTENKGELSKVSRKIRFLSPKMIVGLSPLNRKSKDLSIAKDLGEILDACVINSEDIDKIEDAKEKSPYILIDEEALDNPSTIDFSDYEDYKIILVKKNSHKNELAYNIKELERLEIKFLGVIYHK